MEFSQKKLPAEAAPRMRLCPIHTVKPHALMLAPVYVFMKLNEKFVAVKAPLDFFTEGELQRLLPFEAFFIPDFVETTLPFRHAARTARALLSWDPKLETAAEDGGEYPKVALPPSPYELSDAILRLIGSLWVQTENGPVIEPFFVAVFANELCDLMPGDVLKQARDASVERYERGIFLSSWCVFLALHLGYCDLAFLNELRFRIFSETVAEQDSSVAEMPEIVELVDAARASMEGRYRGEVTADYFRGGVNRVSQKLAGRIERVKKSLVTRQGAVATIHGLKGFVDV